MASTKLALFRSSWLTKTALLILLWVMVFALNAPIAQVLDLLDPGSVAILGLWIFLAIFLFPSKIEKTSDIFFVIYIPIAFLGNSFVWLYVGVLDKGEALFLLLLNAAPFILLRALVRFSGKIRFGIVLPVGFPSVLLPFFLMCFLVASMAVGFFVNGDIGSFDFSSHYDRRFTMMERIASSGNKFFAYFLSMTNVGVLTLLAFVSGHQKRLGFAFLYGTFVLFFAAAQFWLFGTKSTLFYGVFMFGLGRFFGGENFEKFPMYFLWALVLVSLAAVFDRCFNEISYINTVVVNRAFVLAAEVQNYYLDAVIHKQPEAVLSGLHLGDHRSVDFFIGQEYYQSPAAEVNASAFISALAVGGLSLYVACVFCVCAFFLFINSLHQRMRQPAVIAIATTYAICLLGQSFSVALVSSGVFLSLLLVMIFSRTALVKFSI